MEIWNDPLMTAGAGTFIDDLITRAGGRNLAGDVDGWPQISPELVVASKPDVIILTCFNKAEVMARPAWQKIPAVSVAPCTSLYPTSLLGQAHGWLTGLRRWRPYSTPPAYSG